MTLTIVAAIVVAVFIGAVVFARRNRGSGLPAALAAGNPFPPMQLADDHGNPVSVSSERDTALVLIFLRGGWCPFCTSQVEQLTASYREITEHNAELVFVTPKPLDTTRRVAEVFGVDFTFWVDQDLKLARELGIYHPDAVPERFREKFGADAFRPASVIVDRAGIIRFARVAPDVRTRPDPKELVSVLRTLQ
ncbi:MAG: redoxin domain-containing protein [Pseudomonadota bacterium]